MFATKLLANQCSAVLPADEASRRGKRAANGHWLQNKPVVQERLFILLTGISAIKLEPACLH